MKLASKFSAIVISIFGLGILESTFPCLSQKATAITTDELKEIAQSITVKITVRKCDPEKTCSYCLGNEIE